MFQLGIHIWSLSHAGLVQICQPWQVRRVHCPCWSGRRLSQKTKVRLRTLFLRQLMKSHCPATAMLFTRRKAMQDAGMQTALPSMSKDQRKAEKDKKKALLNAKHLLRWVWATGGKCFPESCAILCSLRCDGCGEDACRTVSVPGYPFLNHDWSSIYSESPR